MTVPVTVPDGALVLMIPAPCSLLNANHRRHWRVKARMVKAWRRAAAGEAGVGSPIPTPVHVTVIVHRHHNRGYYDAGNYAPTAKAVLDGIVDAGVLPDDRNAYVIGPDLRAGEPWPAGGVTVLLEPVTTATPLSDALTRLAANTKAGDPLWTS
jgi:hypothetical protein